MQETPPIDPEKPQNAQQPTPGVPPVTNQQPDYLHPIVDAPKHAYHPRRVILMLSAAVIVCLVAVAILIAYAAMPAKTSKKAVQSTSDSSKTLEPLTANETLNRLRVTLKASTDASQPILLPVTAPKKGFFTVIPDKTAVAGIVEQVEPKLLTSTLDSVLKSLETNTFTKISLRDTDDPAGYLSYFTRDDVICQVTITPKPIEPAPRALEADCTDMSVYTEYANIQETYAALYTPATTTSTPVAFTGKPTVKPSVSAGYSTTELSVSTVIDHKLTSSGTAALFYQSPDMLWHYFIDRDGAVLVDCSKYKQTATLYAYAGQTCSISNSVKTSIVTAPKKK